MAIRYYKPIWEIDPEYVKTLPVMDFWRDIYGNIIDFEAEKAKGHTGFLYEIGRPNTQLYDGSKKIDDEISRYRGTGGCCIAYDEKYGTNGIKRTVLEFHSGTREELYEAEGKLLKELGVVENDRYLNMTDETMLNRVNNTNVHPSFGEIIAIGLDGTQYRFENEKHAADELSKIFNKRVTPRTISKCLKGTCLSYRKYLLDIRPAGMSVVDEVLLEQKRAEKEEKDKVSMEKRLKSIIKTTSTPEWKKNFSEICKEVQNRPEVKEKKKKSLEITNQKPEVRSRRSKANKKAWSRPEVKEKHRKANKEAQNRPGVAAKRSKSAKKAHQRPETKAKRRKIHEARKKEGILVFQNENTPDLKFKGKKDGAKKANVKTSTFKGWIHSVSKTFKKYGIKKIIWDGKVIE